MSIWSFSKTQVVCWPYVTLTLKDKTCTRGQKMLRHILPGDRCCPLLEHTTFISHNSLQRNLFIFLGEPVFIKYGSPSVSSTVTTHKQSDIKSRLREPKEVKCLTFCDLDNGSQRGAIKSRRVPQKVSSKASHPSPTQSKK